MLISGLGPAETVHFEHVKEARLGGSLEADHVGKNFFEKLTVKEVH